MADAAYHRSVAADGAIRYDVVPASATGPYIGQAVVLGCAGLLVSCSAAALPRGAEGFSAVLVLFGMAFGLGGVGHAVWRLTNREASTVVVQPNRGVVVNGLLHRADDVERLEVVAPSGEVLYQSRSSAVFVGTGLVGLPVAVAASAAVAAFQAAGAVSRAVRDARDRREIRLVLNRRSDGSQHPVAKGLTVGVANRLLDHLADDLGWLEPHGAAAARNASSPPAASVGGAPGGPGSTASVSGDGTHGPALPAQPRVDIPGLMESIDAALHRCWRLKWFRWATAALAAVVAVSAGTALVKHMQRVRADQEAMREFNAVNAIFDEAARRAGVTSRDLGRNGLIDWRISYGSLPKPKLIAFGREFFVTAAPYFETIKAGSGSDRGAVDVCNAVVLFDFQGVALHQYGVRVPYWGATGIDEALAAKISTAPHADIVRDCARRLGHPVPP